LSTFTKQQGAKRHSFTTEHSSQTHMPIDTNYIIYTFFLSDFYSKDVNLDNTALLLCLVGKFHLHKASRKIHSNPNFRMFSSDI